MEMIDILDVTPGSETLRPTIATANKANVKLDISGLANILIKRKDIILLNELLKEGE